MKIGVLSDTHGQYERTRLAIELLRKRGAEFFIHCGDVGGEHMLDLLAGLRGAFVWGNCDYSRSELERYGKMLGLACYGPQGRFELDGKQIAVLHGDDSRAMRLLQMSKDFDYLFYGHTHVLEDRQDGRCRIVNPGALHRATRKTVALVDTAEGSVEHLDVE